MMLLSLTVHRYRRLANGALLTESVTTVCYMQKSSVEKIIPCVFFSKVIETL